MLLFVWQVKNLLHQAESGLVQCYRKVPQWAANKSCAKGGRKVPYGILMLVAYHPVVRPLPDEAHSIVVAERKDQATVVEKGREYRMHFRADKGALLPQADSSGLSSLDEHAVETPAEGSDTNAFRAVLGRGTLDKDQKAATRVTEPALTVILSPRKSAGAGTWQRQRMRRWVSIRAMALLVFVGMAVPLLDSRLGVLAFGMVAQIADAPTLRLLGPSGAQAGLALPSTPGNHSRPGDSLNGPTPTPTPIPPPPPPPPPSYTPDGPYSNWTPPPGYNSFAVTEPSPDPWASSWGQCTWWAQYKRQDEDFSGFGNAMSWDENARARGYTVTSTAAANATVVFEPGVQGASSQGHVSHVEKILTGGWVLVSEMNFYWNGGGFARVNYRYIHVGAGVWFIH